MGAVPQAAVLATILAVTLGVEMANTDVVPFAVALALVIAWRQVARWRRGRG